jgi:hypothetical protein
VAHHITQIITPVHRYEQIPHINLAAQTRGGAVSREWNTKDRGFRIAKVDFPTTLETAAGPAPLDSKPSI